MAPIRNSRSSKQVQPSALHGNSRNQFQATRNATPPPKPSPSPHAFPKAPDDPRPPPLALRDLECVRTLGQGIYGKVVLVSVRRHNSKHPLDKPGTVFAMKIINKRESDKQNPTEKNCERQQLSQLPWSPFVNGIIQTFVDHKNLYLMLEFISCGSLHTAIQKRGPFDNATAAFYFSNIVCGLGFLQEHGIVHRDLKPDNILMGPDGYLCLADFGQAKKEDDDSTWLLIGTPAYMAPELIEPQDYIGQAIDWWASGCILYEMLTRKRPFYSRNNEKSTFKAVVSGEFTWPPDLRIGRNLRSLVSGLLTIDAEKRLGTDGAFEVTEHPWLGNVNWQKMHSRQYIAPYVPKTPKLTELWLDKPLPHQDTVPCLPVVEPPVHLRHDQRFPCERQL